MKRARLLLALGGLSAGFACSDMSLSYDEQLDNAVFDTGDAGAEGPDETLRIDVYPSTSPDGAISLLNESFFLADEKDWGALSLKLSAPLSLSGVLTGFDANAHFDVSVPGEVVDVEGELVAQIPGTPMEERVVTEDAAFSISVVPGPGYTVAWLPLDPQELPLLVEEEISLRAEVELSRELDYGVPLYGSVFDPDGEGMGNMNIQLLHPSTGIEGPSVTTDARGEYELRAYPGEWILRVEGGSNRYYLPTHERSVVVSDEGASETFSYPYVDSIFVSGQVVDAEGDLQDDVTVRFIAADLDPESSLVVETKTDRNGLFSVQVIEGQYLVEFIPDYELSISPRVLSEVVSVQGTMELGTIALEDHVQVEGWVVGPADAPTPVEGAWVSARELAFDNYVYETTTDAEGRFSLDVPDTPLLWTLTPPSDLTAAVTRVEGDPAQISSMKGQTLQFVSGERIAGCVSFEGEGMAYTPLEVMDADQTRYATAVTGEDGCFEVLIDL